MALTAQDRHYGGYEGTGPFELARQAATALVGAIGAPPELVVVLGSGWQEAADALGAEYIEASVGDLPGFQLPTVGGHKGLFRSLDVAGHRVLVLLGRSHVYEGLGPSEVVHAVRAGVMAGAKTVVLTNAAGSLRNKLTVGKPVLIRDHLNLTGCSPLAGQAPPSQYMSRFLDLSDLYSTRLRKLVTAAHPGLVEGVYAAMPGPSYETPAEVAMLRAIGADLVGMSTVLEAIAAKHLGAEVLGISLVTNLAAGTSPGPLSHAEVMSAGRRSAPDLGRLLAAAVPAVLGSGQP